MENIEKVIVLGAGPAGMSAALYAARAELSPLVLTGIQPGGQVALTNTIENYPGFPDGVGGQELGDLFQRQAERFGARIEFDSIVSVDLRKQPFRVKTYSKEYFTKSLIIATGANPVKLGVPGENEFIGKGTSYCATCDGWFFKEKNVFVIGGGDSALEEALFLTRYASHITIVHRRDEFRAGPILQSRLHESPKISLKMETVVKEIKGKDKVEEIVLTNVKTGENETLSADGVFVFIGHTPNNEFYTGQLKMDPKGYIEVDSKMHTSVEGVYAAGEAADSNFKQVITSAGMGAAAAIEAAKYLADRN
jgi:thioredoxin reductase (NADPH)